MKKLIVCAYVLARTTALLGPSAPRQMRQQCGGVIIRSQAEEHLEKMSNKWKVLQEKEKELLLKDPSSSGMDLAIEMLETAIEHVHTKEEVEEEHIAALHGALKRVLEKEDALEMAKKATHDVEEDSENILHSYEAGQYGEDKEKRRELAVADLSYRIEDYLEERLRQSKEEERRVRLEGDEAIKELEALKLNEWDLKETLAELKALKSQKERDQKQ
jgi:hypothetical protein